MKSIILASASPRRKELLSQIGIEYEVIPSNTEEIITSALPCEIVMELAKQKAEDIVGKINTPGKIVLGADTNVAFNDKVMGKPSDKDAAVAMISMLENATHQVYTGVSLSYLKENGEICSHVFYEKTDVVVYPMSKEEILAYVETGDCMDKAGSYGIQGAFAAYIKGIKGDYNNVVGLPIGRVYQELKNILISS